MLEVTFAAWQPGLNAVQLIRLMRDFTPLSLSEAKEAVEALLSGNHVSVYVDSVSAKEELIERARIMGALAN